MFTPVLAKHTKSFNLIDTLAVGVDRIQRNFEPLQRQVEVWRKTQVTDERAKLIFYNAFIDGAQKNGMANQPTRCGKDSMLNINGCFRLARTQNHQRRSRPVSMSANPFHPMA